MIKPLMDKIITDLNLNVVGESSHQFEKYNGARGPEGASHPCGPYGVTMIYLLAESHLSIHTFVDEGKIALDLFTCSLSIETEKLKSIIKDYFEVNSLNIQALYFTRGD